MAENDRASWGPVEFEDKVTEAGFVTVPVAVVFAQDLSPGAKTLYSALLWWGWKYRQAPPQERMAQELGVTSRTIKRYMQELDAGGYVHSRRQGLGQPNRYVICKVTAEGTDLSLQSGHTRPFRGDRFGPSHIEDSDSTTQTSQQQLPADPDPEANQGAPGDPPGGVVVAPSDRYTTGRTLEVPQRTAPITKGKTIVVEQRTGPGEDDLTARLTALGVAKRTAKKLVAENDRETVDRWLEYTTWRVNSGARFRESPAAYLVGALNGGDWVIPDWFRTPAEKAQASEAEEAGRIAAQAAEEARIAAERAEDLGRLAALSADERERLEADCRATLPPGLSEKFIAVVLPGLVAGRLRGAETNGH